MRLCAHHPDVGVYLGNFPQRRLVHQRRADFLLCRYHHAIRRCSPLTCQWRQTRACENHILLLSLYHTVWFPLPHKPSAHPHICTPARKMQSHPKPHPSWARRREGDMRRLTFDSKGGATALDGIQSVFDLHKFARGRESSEREAVI